MAINTPNYLPQTPRENEDKYMYGATTEGGDYRRDREGDEYDPYKNYDRRASDYNTKY